VLLHGAYSKEKTLLAIHPLPLGWALALPKGALWLFQVNPPLHTGDTQVFHGQQTAFPSARINPKGSWLHHRWGQAMEEYERYGQSDPENEHEQADQVNNCQPADAFLP
jgi:hypothetical protein